MSLHYIFGGSGAGKSYQLYREMLKRAKGNPKEKIIVLVPEQFTLQTQKDFVTLDPETKGIMNIDVLSFLRLAYRVFEETGGGDRSVLEDTGKSMIVKKVALEHESDLKVFGRNVKKAGFISELKSILSEFYQYGIGEEELAKLQEFARGNASLSRKLEDLSLLYRGFQDFLADRYITTEGILDLLREKVPESKLLKDCVLCFDGFTGFTPSQYALIGALMRQAKECYVTVTMDAELVYKEQKEYDLFYLSYKTVRWLDKVAVQSGQEIAPPVILKERGRYGAAPGLKYLEQNLFRVKRAKTQEAEQDIRIFAHKNIREEINWVVTQIYCLVKSGKYRYREIAIIAADLESYAEGLAAEFARANLPGFIDHKKKILDNPVVEFVNALLEIVAQDFSYDSVFHYIKSPLSGFSEEERDGMENYVIALGIRGLNAYKKEWKRRYKTKYSFDMEQLNSSKNKLVEKLEAFYQVMKQKDSTGREKMTALFQVLSEHRAEQYLAGLAEKLKESEPLRAREYGQIWRILLEVFDRIVSLMGEEVMTQKEFAEILLTGFEEAKVGLVPPGIDQVLVGDMERTRLKDIRVLFFLGMNEGAVPKPIAGGGVLSEQDRAMFAKQGIELAPNRKQSAFLSEFYLYLNLTKPSEKLYLSYRKTDTEGKAMRPSYLLGRVMKLFPDMKVEFRGETLEDCLGTDMGFQWFLGGIQEYLRSGECKPYFRELYQMYFGEKWPMPLSREAIAEAAFYRKPEHGLSAENAKQLYGTVLKGSVTRLEKYAECAFAHFLIHGLGLEERAEYQIRMPDIGTLYHSALQIYSDSLKKKGYRWNCDEEEDEERAKEKAEESSRLLKEAVRLAAEEYGNEIFKSSNRNANLLLRIERMLKRTVDTVKYQIRAGHFEPEEFEYDFIHADRYLNLKGRIDRIDLCEDEGNIYLRVVDYKSGSTDFNLEKLYYGLQLQLAVYMEAAMEWAEQKYPDKVRSAVEENSEEERSVVEENSEGEREKTEKKETNGKFIPAGMLYYHIEDPVVEKGSDAEAEIRKKLAMKGLVNAKKQAIIHMDKAFASPGGALAGGVTSNVVPVNTKKSGELGSHSKVAEEKDFYNILRHAREKLFENAKKILDGDTDPSPYRRGPESACTYCAMKEVCNFDLKTEGYHYQKLEKIDDETILNLLSSGKESKDGNEMDKGTEAGH